MMAGAAEQNRKGRRRRLAHPKFVCRYDGSERNYMRSLRTPGGACHCGLRIKIRRDDSNNCPRNQQHCDKFEPAIHRKTASIILIQSSHRDCQIMPAHFSHFRLTLSEH
jgi:hypothetical protein